MKNVVCFGEVLIDFLNIKSVQAGVLKINQFQQFPGGAPANAAVAVSKLGGSAKFLGQVGAGSFGAFLLDALKKFKVDTQYTLVHPSAKTPLAFVFLDEGGERHFSFRRDGTADLVFKAEYVQNEWLEKDDIFHFCSNTLTESGIAAQTGELIKRAKAAGMFISFDVNLRHNLWPDGSIEIDLVNALVKQSDLLKFSREEFVYLSREDDSSYIKQLFSCGVKVILITDGAKPISVIYPDQVYIVQTPEVNVVDTTGGGDSFIGACLYGLSRDKQAGQLIANKSNFLSLVEFAARCGGLAVSRAGTFPAMPTFAEVSDYWSEV